MKFKIFIPFRASDVLIEDSYREYFWNFLDELEKLSAKDFNYREDLNISKLKFRFGTENELKLVEHIWEYNFMFCDKLLLLDINIEDVKTKEDQNKIIEPVQSLLRDLIITQCIAKQGIADLGTFSTRFQATNQIGRISPCIHALDVAVQTSEKYSWPKLKEQSLKETLAWYSKYYSETKGISKTKLGRALHAFSYNFETKGGKKAPSDIFWAVMGLDPSYGEGNQALQKQLNQKSQLLLGARSEYKKRFSQLKDFRSRWIHGDLDFENKFSDNDYGMSEEIDLYFDKMYDSAGFASAILIGTFQELILSKLNTLEFEYVLKSAPNKT
jgi:hypothetical protein